MAFNFKENVDLKKDAGWLLPGLEVKRWFLLIFLGSIMIVLGFMVLANVRPIYLTLELIRKAALVLPSNVLAAIFILIGGVIFFKMNYKTKLQKGVTTLKTREKYGAVLSNPAMIIAIVIQVGPAIHAIPAILLMAILT